MTKCVLVVEDHEMNLKLICDLLEAHGVRTVAAMEGEAALDLAREHRPDLILMDLQLPGISGFDVTLHLKADTDLRDIPVVAVTALARERDKETALEAGCDAYIRKPISAASFIATVNEFLERTS